MNWIEYAILIVALAIIFLNGVFDYQKLNKRMDNMSRLRVTEFRIDDSKPLYIGGDDVNFEWEHENEIGFGVNGTVEFYAIQCYYCGSEDYKEIYTKYFMEWYGFVDKYFAHLCNSCNKLFTVEEHHHPTTYTTKPYGGD